MKFYCDKCQTKYAIADDKVRGKVLKVRCKKCSHVITVREPVAPGVVSNPRPVQARPPVQATRQVKWHYSINGQSFGPFDLDDLQGRFARGELGDAAYVWNETFTEWKPVGDVVEFGAALTAAHKLVPRKKTIGISQALEAIRPEEERRVREAAADPEPEPAPARQSSASQERSPRAALKVEPKVEPKAALKLEPKAALKVEPKAAAEPEAKQPLKIEPEPASTLKSRREAASNAPLAGVLSPSRIEKSPVTEEADSGEGLDVEPGSGDSAPEQEDLKEAITLKRTPALVDRDRGAPSTAASRRDRLQKLRDRLNVAGDSEASDDDELDIALGDTAEAIDGPEDTAAGLGALGSQVSEPAEDKVEVPADHDEELAAQGPTDEESDADFALPSPEEVLGNANDGMFATFSPDAQPKPSGEQDEDLGDQIPFFAAAPKLGTTKSPASGSVREEITGSLLIQLDKIKKQGRGKTIALVVVSIFVVGTAIGLGLYLAPEKKEPEVVTRIASPHRAPQFRTYSKEERSKIGQIMQLEDEVINFDEAEVMMDEEQDKEQAASTKRVAVAQRETKTPVVRGSTKVDIAIDPFEAAMDGARSHTGSSGGSGINRAGSQRAVIASADREEGSTDTDRFNALAAIQSPSTDSPIYRPKTPTRDKKSASKGSASLTPEQVQEGIQTVRRSIVMCRERQMRHGMALDARKIYVSLDVQPTGRVSQFKVEPASVQNTEFDRCMQSHTPRWRFPEFGGDWFTIRAPFVIQ